MLGGAGSQHPQHTVKCGAHVLARTVSFLGEVGWSEQRCEDVLWLVGHVHAVECEGQQEIIHTLTWRFMR